MSESIITTSETTETTTTAWESSEAEALYLGLVAPVQESWQAAEAARLAREAAEMEEGLALVSFGRGLDKLVSSMLTLGESAEVVQGRLSSDLGVQWETIRGYRTAAQTLDKLDVPAEVKAAFGVSGAMALRGVKEEDRASVATTAFETASAETPEGETVKVSDRAARTARDDWKEENPSEAEKKAKPSVVSTLVKTKAVKDGASASIEAARLLGFVALEGDETAEAEAVQALFVSIGMVGQAMRKKAPKATPETIRQALAQLFFFGPAEESK